MNLEELIPTIPKYINKNEYLSYIACINQEWNRNQISFEKGQFSSTNNKIIRIDLARNCLNAYLWKIILFVEEEGKIIPFSHGWFNFPNKLYAQLFEKKNKISYSKYKKPLENWIDPKNKKVDLKLLRSVIIEKKLSYRLTNISRNPYLLLIY
ncbi:MAG: hypothetical protein HYU67_01395 [Flavobacteriia bacterium]|nr:hypothetical protein [Flavobacteriia bacterium]